MAANIDHTAFPQPDDGTTKIWRYVDLAKFVAIIKLRKLFFCRLRNFRDPFEGSFGKFNYENRGSIYNDLIRKSPDLLKQIEAITQRGRNSICVNCWHLNDHESAATWDLYGSHRQTIAIQSTYTKLVKCLPEEFLVGVVDYVDYDNFFIDESNTFNPVMHKRKSFEHEREVRAVIDIDTLNVGQKFSHLISDQGLELEVDPPSLIENIYVSPDSANWYCEVVAEVCRDSGVGCDIMKSKLYGESIF